MYQPADGFNKHRLLRLVLDGRTWVVDAVEPAPPAKVRLDWRVPANVPAHEALAMAQEEFRGSLVYVSAPEQQQAAG